MRQNLFYSLLFLIIFNSCGKKRILKAEKNISLNILQGDWVSNSDSGIVILRNKDLNLFAIVRNGAVTSDDSYTYRIIDSVEYENGKKKILSTYLVTYELTEAIKYIYEIKVRRDSLLTLKLKGSKPVTFKFTKKR